MAFDVQIHIHHKHYCSFRCLYIEYSRILQILWQDSQAWLWVTVEEAYIMTAAICSRSGIVTGVLRTWAKGFIFSKHLIVSFLYSVINEFRTSIMHLRQRERDWVAAAVWQFLSILEFFCANTCSGSRPSINFANCFLFFPKMLLLHKWEKGHAKYLIRASALLR